MKKIKKITLSAEIYSNKNKQILIKISKEKNWIKIIGRRQRK